MVEGITKTKENFYACRFVGTTHKAGLTQLEVLKEAGLKPHNTIFEIGCGALTAGVPIIRYLDSDKYWGTDPNSWLRESTLKIEQNRDILDKNPVFYSNDNFQPTDEKRFDFIFAHSIFNHAADWQWELFLDNVGKYMNEATVILISLLFAEGNKYGNPGYGVWDKNVAAINSDKWMHQDVIYVDGKPRGDQKGKVNFKTKKYVFDSCKERHLKCEILDDYAQFYKKHSGTNECKDWIRITKEEV